MWKKIDVRGATAMQKQKNDILTFHSNITWNKKCKAKWYHNIKKLGSKCIWQLNWQAHVYSNYWVGVQFNYSSKETNTRLAIGSKMTMLMKTKRRLKAHLRSNCIINSNVNDNVVLSFNSLSSFLLLLG